MNEHIASIVPCTSYDATQISAAMDELINSFNALDWVKSGMKVLIKANLVSALAPEKAATTHPALICELVKRLTFLGANVIIGDSPGGFFSVSALEHNYNVTGMVQAEKLGAKLNKDVSIRTVKLDGIVMKSLTYTSYLDDCDGIINFCKLKSHGMVGMSCAVKNMYGVIPGLIKPETHYLYPNIADFSNMLIDINEYFKPKLTLVDAIVGMEGNGPTAGTPKHIGALIGAKTGYVADLIAAEILGLNYMDVPTICASIERKLAPTSLNDISVYGNIKELKAADFDVSAPKGIRFLSGTKFLIAQNFIEACLANKPKLDSKKCIGCAKCASMCPAKAISMVKGKPEINRKKCIRCFCCQEFCPKAAMTVHRPLPVRILQHKG